MQTKIKNPKTKLVNKSLKPIQGSSVTFMDRPFSGNVDQLANYNYSLESSLTNQSQIPKQNCKTQLVASMLM